MDLQHLQGVVLHRRQDVLEQLEELDHADLILREMADAETRVASLTADCERLEAKKGDLETEVEQATMYHDSALADLATSARRAEAAHAAALQTLEAHRENVALLNEDARTSQMATITAEVEQCRAEAAQEIVTLTLDLATRREQTTQALEALRQEHAAAQEVASALTTEVAMLESKRDALQAEIANLLTRFQG